jgi:hypothetical protein
MMSQTRGNKVVAAVRFAHAGVLFLGLALLAPSGIQAAALQQTGGSANSPQAGIRASTSSSEGERGFLFQRPRGTIAIRSGLLFHRAGSDVFTFAEERFTVSRSDFRAISIGLEGDNHTGCAKTTLCGLFFEKCLL